MSPVPLQRGPWLAALTHLTTAGDKRRTGTRAEFPPTPLMHKGTSVGRVPGDFSWGPWGGKPSRSQAAEKEADCQMVEALEQN